jgi:hypothetical protein
LVENTSKHSFQALKIVKNPQLTENHQFYKLNLLALLTVVTGIFETVQS